MATPKNSQQAFSNLQNYQSKIQAPDQLLSSYNEKLGVPAAQQQVSGLRQAITNTTNLLNQIPGSVYGRTANSLVTSGQAGRQIAGESAPVQQNLANQGNQYSEAQGAYDRLTQQAQAQAGLAQQGQQDQLQALQGIYSNLYTREQDALARQLEKQKLAEQARQFNASLKASSGSGGGGPSINLGGGSNSRSTSSDLKNRAMTDVGQLMGRKGSADFYREISAIYKSAGYGNNYDKAKLELIRSSFPGLFSGNKLKQSNIDKLIANLTASSQTSNKNFSARRR